MNNMSLSTTLRGLPISSIYGEGHFQNDIEADIFFADEVLPLRGASHGDIVAYVIDAPLRYSECFGLSANGERIAFENKHCFMGWSTSDDLGSLLFENKGLRIEFRVGPDNADGRHRTGPLIAIEHHSISQSSRVCRQQFSRKNDRCFVATDGSLFALERCELEALV